MSDDAIIAGSGAAIIDVSRVARDYALTGLEFACGIPGSIGGAVFMNAGAYGGEVKVVLIMRYALMKMEFNQINYARIRTRL